MELLAQQIGSILADEKYCFVRPDQLHRVWPDLGEAERENVVRHFADEHGWRIFTYSRVLGAMVVRGTSAHSEA